MTNKLKSIFTVLTLSGSLIASAQAIRYSYDAAGNRVKREIVMAPQNAPQHKGASTYYTDHISKDYRVKLHTDAASGRIRVEVIAARGGYRGTVTAYTLSGMKVQECTVEDGNAYVDLNDSPSGAYILHIDINGKTTDWKIIKK